MSSNQRKNNNQRRSNSNYNNNNQQNNKNQQQKRARYQPKTYNQNTASPTSSARGYNNNAPNAPNHQYSPKQSPKRSYNNQRSAGPSSPNNRPNRGQNRHYNQYPNTNTNSDDIINNVNNGQRFKLKPTTNQRHDQYNPNYRHNNNNTNNPQGNQSPYNRSRRNSNNNNNNNPPYNDMPGNNELPPGFTGGANEQNYPPNQYRPNNTNNSERNRNWRNRFNPVQDPSDVSPTFRPPINPSNRGYMDNNPHRTHHNHSRSPQNAPSGAYNKNVNDININISTQSPGFQAHPTPIYKGSNSPLIQGQNVLNAPVGTPRSDNSASQQANAVSNVQSADITTTGNTSDCAGCELFGTLYGNNGTEPSIAYPVITLCLNANEGDIDAELNFEYKEQRKYPVEWLLGIGKDINSAPNHPKDDIPESVKFINTIKIAGNKWKQKQLQTNNTPNTVVPNTKNRFGSIHQLTPHQLPQNQVTPKMNKTDDDQQRSWRNSNNKTQIHDDNEDGIMDLDIEELNISPKGLKMEDIEAQLEGMERCNDDLNNEKDAKEGEGKDEDHDHDHDNDDILNKDELELINKDEQDEQDEQDELDNELTEPGQMLLDGQDAQDKQDEEAKAEADEEMVDEDLRLDEDSEDLDQYKVQHHTPELVADPRELVEEDLNIAPAWARDDEEGNDDTEAIINTDFKFGVIDKDREKEHFKNTGTLPSETATITREEYELRQKEKEKEKEKENGNDDEDLDRPRKPPLPHPDARHTFAFHSDHPALPLGVPLGGSHRDRISLRSQSTPDHRDRSGYHGMTESLPIDKLPSRIRGIVIRLDEDIQKISSYIQTVALEKDQLNRYQRHLHKLIARRGQYANWWKTQQKKHQSVHKSSDESVTHHSHHQQQQQSSSVSSNLRHTNSLQQLEHYKDYYNKQLEKMVASASTDPKFNTYVDYYRQKLKAVEKRQRELENRSSNKEDKNELKPSSIIDVISTKKTTQKKNNEQGLVLQSNASSGDTDDPFASLNLQDFGYTTAATTATSNAATSSTTVNVPSKANANANANVPLPAPAADDPMWDRYIYGAHAPPPRHQQQQQQQIKQRNISAQKQKLKQYIRQHALKYVKPPPDPHDETYPHWYQGLRKVENIIYAKYMNKQRKRMEAAQAQAQVQHTGNNSNNTNNNNGGGNKRNKDDTQNDHYYQSSSYHHRAPAQPQTQPQPQPQAHQSPYGPMPPPQPQQQQQQAPPRQQTAQTQANHHQSSPYVYPPPSHHPHHPHHHPHQNPHYPQQSPPNAPPGPPVHSAHYPPLAHTHHSHISGHNPPSHHHQQQSGAPHNQQQQQQSPYHHHQQQQSPQQSPMHPHHPQSTHSSRPHSSHSHSHSMHPSHPSHPSSTSPTVNPHAQPPPSHHHQQQHQHRMTHLNISPPPHQQQPQAQPQVQQQPQPRSPPSHAHHTLSQHPMHPQSLNSPSMYHNMNNMMNMNMSPPMSPQGQNHNKYAQTMHQSPPNAHHHPAPPYPHHQYQSPPNPNPNPNPNSNPIPNQTTTTQHGYTTYNTSSPPNPQMQHAYQQYPQ